MNVRRKIYQRNQLFEQIRSFFKQRKVLEVDTSLLRPFSVTDPYMAAFSVISPSNTPQGYLQTSPEYAMKQLLCQGAGDIFQLGKMFRADEKSPVHAAEFTLLEWYRIGFDHHQLIQEVCQLIQDVVGQKKIQWVSYQRAFIDRLGFDPFDISLEKLSAISRKLLGDIPRHLLLDNYLSLLCTEKIEPAFDQQTITVLHGFPAGQASLAKMSKQNGVTSADRFEVYLAGVELANGFNELTDAKIQYQRFEKDNQIRQQLGVNTVDIDQGFIQSLERGLPDCAGVALGIDRLLMVKLGKQNIEDVLLGA